MLPAPLAAWTSLGQPRPASQADARDVQVAGQVQPPVEMTGAPARRRATLAYVAVAIALALLQTALLARTAWDKSDTADETRYVSSAAVLWATRSFRDLCEAPVLPKWGFAVALAAAGTPLATAGSTWQDAMAHLIRGQRAEVLRKTFFAARTATVAVVVLAGLLLWRAGARFGPRVGLIAQALWCFSPTVLANGSLAALDAWSAALMCAVVLTAMRTLERPTLPRAALVGCAAGGLAATKVTALLVVPVGAVLAAWWLLGARDVRLTTGRLAALAGVTVAALLATLWALYGFSVGGVDPSDPCPFLADAAPAPAGAWPFPAWIEGALFQFRHARAGHANYLFGETSESGWWWFYLAALALKVTIGAQAMALLRIAADLVLVAREEPVDRRSTVALLAFPAVLLVAISAGRHQPNVSFLLPAVPLAILWLASGLVSVERAFARVGRIVYLGLLGAAIVESVRLHPHHLMFYNLWAGGPLGGPRYLIQREDWGQDKRRLAEWQRENRIEHLFYAGYGPNAAEWGVVGETVPCEPTEGVYALHAVEVHRPRFALAPGCVDWLTVEPPDERIGYSIYVYRVDAARVARLAKRRRAGGEVFWQSAGAASRNAGPTDGGPVR